MPDEKSPIDIGPTTDPKFVLRSKKMDLDAGWIGRVIASPANAGNNIAFVVVVLVILAGMLVIVVFPADRIEFWKIILPILTLTLGYLFGKSRGA